MSTRSFICIEDEHEGYEGFRGIYCHYDGYPDHVGRMLKTFHNSITAAEDIVHGSQIRMFRQDGTIERFDERAGGPDDESEFYLSMEEALGSGFDYLYVFSLQDNCWKCFAIPATYKFIEERKIPT